jgi:uncharacterized membrane protein YtjA (UPF0391 family)
MRSAAVFFVVALFAAVVGSLGIVGAVVNVARLFFYIFLTLFLVSLVGGLVRRT